MLGEKLKALREERHFTQEDVASRLNVTRQALSKWENNITEPDIDTIKKLGAIYDVSISDLIGEEKKDRIGIWNKGGLFFGIFIFGLNVAIIFIYLRFLEDIIPAHYDVHFNVDRYGSKYETLLYLIIYPIFLGMSIVGYYMTNRELEKQNRIGGLVVNSLGSIINLGFGIFVVCLNTRYLKEDSLLPIVGAIAGALILLVSIMSHPAVNKKQNGILGVRTSFTMSSKDAWVKLNRLGAYVMGISATATLLLFLFVQNKSIVFLGWIPLLVGVVLIMICNYVWQFKSKKAATSK